MAEVVVVGAGVGGLSAAITLAARGMRVRVLEATERPGGKIGIATVDGVEVDTGPSVLTLPDTLDRVLRLAGTSLRDQLELLELQPNFRYLYPDGVVLDVFGDPERTLVSVQNTLGRRAALELKGFLAYSARIWHAAAPAFILGDAPGLRTFPRQLGALVSLRHIDPLRTMWGAICSRVRSPHLRMLLARYATYNGSDPRRAPATLNCIAHVELALGGYGVRGGMYEIVRALVRAAEGVGVELHFGEWVGRIRTAGQRVLGVETENGRFWNADAVIGNADAAHVLSDLLPSSFRQRQQVLRPEPSMSGWVGILRARRRNGSSARVAHTVLFPRDYMLEFRDIFDRARPPGEPTVYLCAQERCHGRRGWPEHEPVFLMANAPAEPAEGKSDAAVWDELRERVRHRLEDAGLADAGDELVWERTPSGLAAHFPGSRGSIYGAASNTAWAAFRRPPNRVAGVRGLYLASGSAHPGGGVPLCLLSGQAAARALFSDRGMPLPPSPAGHAG